MYLFSYSLTTVQKVANHCPSSMKQLFREFQVCSPFGGYMIFGCSGGLTVKMQTKQAVTVVILGLVPWSRGTEHWLSEPLGLHQWLVWKHTSSSVADQSLVLGQLIILFNHPTVVLNGDAISFSLCSPGFLNFHMLYPFKSLVWVFKDCHVSYHLVEMWKLYIKRDRFCHLLLYVNVGPRLSCSGFGLGPLSSMSSNLHL